MTGGSVFGVIILIIGIILIPIAYSVLSTNIPLSVNITILGIIMIISGGLIALSQSKNVKLKF